MRRYLIKLSKAVKHSTDFFSTGWRPDTLGERRRPDQLDTRRGSRLAAEPHAHVPVGEKRRKSTTLYSVPLWKQSGAWD